MTPGAPLRGPSSVPPGFARGVPAARGGVAVPPAPQRPPATAGDLAVRRLFGRHASGVAIVTADGPAGPAGFTATSLSAVSTAPPLLSFGVARTNPVWPHVAAADHVGVHVLGAGQARLAALFACSGADRFAAAAWVSGPHDVPVLPGCPLWAVGRVRHRFDVGDHVIVVAEVVHVGTGTGEDDPLVHHRGRYRRLDPEPLG